MKSALRDALQDRGYDTLTPVQQAVLEPEVQGSDLLVSAQTGSGKTLGFGLAIAPTLLGEREAFDAADAPLGLIVAPTRELAMQVKRELQWLFAGAGAVLASCVGGMDMRDERRALARGAHIVVATPGRLRDHIMRGSIDMTALRAVVLDEADEMLDLGFREDLEFILGEAPTERQTLLFSATVPDAIVHLAKHYQKDAVRITTRSDAGQHADISYKAMTVAEHDAENAVINALLYYQAPNAIVFGNTRAAVNRLTTRLSNRGMQVVALSGELSQTERTHALQAMRDGRARICVATDVAARGIDLPNLDLVVHAELPRNHETLLHRSGRTGRAGRKGVSVLIVTRKTRKKAERILNMAKVRAEWTDAPSAEAIEAREIDLMFNADTWAETVTGAERETVDRLTETFSAEQLAAAFLRLYRDKRPAPEDLSDPQAKPAPRPEFGASVWFSISGGREAGAEPRRVLPMVLKATGLGKDDIGAIRVRQDETFVQVAEAKAGALPPMGENRELEPGAVMRRLAEAPQLGGGADRAMPERKNKAQGRYRSEGPKEVSPVPRKRKPAASGKEGSKPVRTGKPRAADVSGDPTVKPRKPGKPKGPKPPIGKPNSKKNKARAAAAAKKPRAKSGHRGKQGGPKN